MRKFVLIALLVLSIAISLIAGTLANYTVTIDNIANGSVTGKEFIFTKDGADTFAAQVKIAPTETVVWGFAVKNFEGAIITETDLYYRLSFDVSAFPGKQAIDPLIVTIKDSNGNILNSITGTGIIHIYDSFLLQVNGQSAAYTVEIYWPSNNEIDINYAGGNFSTAINVSATASQVPFAPEDPDESNPDESNPDESNPDESNPDESDPDESDPDESDPGDPNGIEMGDAAIIYQTSAYWTEGQYWDATIGALVGGTDKYVFKFFITNTSDTATIYSWNYEFIFEDEITNFWDCRMASYDPITNKYSIIHPEHYNINIAPGQTIELGGIAIGRGVTELSDIIVNGYGAEIEYQFGAIILP